MSIDRIHAVARHEIGLHLRGPLFWVLLVLLVLALSSLNPGTIIPGERGTLVITSAFVAAENFALTSFFLYAFFAALMGGLAVVRDTEAGITELLGASPLTPEEYLTGKLLGVMGALGFALVIHMLLLIVFAHLLPSWNGADLRGPFALGHYIGPMLLFGLPAVWFCAALAFAIGLKTRKPLAVYAVPVILFAVTVNLFNSTPLTGISKFTEVSLMTLDPSGLRWLRQSVLLVDRGVDFYNTAPIPYDGWFVLARMFAFGAPLLAVLGAACGFQIADGPKAKRKAKAEVEDSAPIGSAAPGFEPLGALRMTGSPPSFWASTRALVRAEGRELRGQPILLLFVGIVLAMLAEFGASAALSEAPVLLTSGTLALGALEITTFLLALLLLFVFTESAHREQTTGFDSLLLATPVRAGALLLGKALAALAFVALVLIACVAVSILMVMTLGQGWWKLGPYVLIWGGVLMPTLVLWTAFVGALVALTQSRYAVYAIAISVLAISFLAALSGATTWLTNWTVAGALTWSDFGAFPLHRTDLLLNRALALGLAVFFGAVAWRAFRRVEPDAAHAHHRRRPAGLIRTALLLAPFAIVPLALGTAISVRLATGFQSAAAKAQAAAYWRANAAVWADAPTPVVAHIDLAVDLYPSRREAAIDGSYTLVNVSSEPLQAIPLTVRPNFDAVAWTIAGEPAVPENRSGLHILPLDAAFAPGDSVRVGFTYTGVYPDGATRDGGGVEQFVLPEGVVLHTLRDSFLPTVGFVDGIGVTDANRTAPAPPDTALWRDIVPPAGAPLRYTTHVTVTAPEAMTVNSVGDLVERAATGDGRARSVWAGDAGALNILAGEWDETRGEGVAVFHHPDHTANVPEIIEALEAARTHLPEWFGPYPWDELRLSAFPNLVTNAQGFPTNISFSESVGFLGRPGGDVAGQAFTVAAHEAAHQWWGTLFRPGEAPGADVFFEGGAHYATLLLHDAARGEGSRKAFARSLEARYLRLRDPQREPTLVASYSDARGYENTVVYDKGAWAFWMLHQHLGADSMQAAFRTFFDAYTEPEDGDFATLHDFLATLRPFAADTTAFDTLTHQLYADTVLPRYHLTDAEAVRLGGNWAVTAMMENEGTGTFAVEVAVVDDDGAFVTQTLTLAAGTSQQLSWTVPFEPTRVVVDPDILVLQAGREEARAWL